MNTKLPVVVGVEIPLDEHGRYNLNALHKASGEGESKKPSEWLRLTSTKSLISELSGNSRLGYAAIKSVRGGVSPGTFAHELLAVSYAGWVRPDFQLKVNQAFIDYRSGTSELKLPSLSHMAGDFEALRNRLTRDEKEESALLTQCSLIMNARKKTKPRRQKLMDALKEAGQGELDLGEEA